MAKLNAQKLTMAAISGLCFAYVLVFIRVAIQLTTLGPNAIFAGDVKIAGLPVAFLDYNGHTGWSVAVNRPAHLILPVLCLLAAVAVVIYQASHQHQARAAKS